MNCKRIRVLVVDDSSLMRELIGDALAEQPDMLVVGKACDGVEALAMLAQQRPDVVTLDLQMPRLDGLATLDRMLLERPTPVIVLSALARQTASITLQALDRGAMDYLAKPVGTAQLRHCLHDELPRKIRNMAGTNVRRIMQLRSQRTEHEPTRTAPATSSRAAWTHCQSNCIVIGISTGGPPALSNLFRTLRPPLPPIVVVQHMPALFTGPFSERLDALSELDVKEAQTGDRLQPNRAIVAPGGKHLSFVRRNNHTEVVIHDGEPVSGHKPSVDVAMRSLAAIYASRCLGVIMTGMGQDGTAGCQAIRAAGGYVLGQDQATSDVYGMNKAAFVAGHVNQQLPLGKLAQAITDRATIGPGVFVSSGANESSISCLTSK